MGGPTTTPGALEAVPAGAERTVAATATVPASAQAVWDLVTDPDRFVEWAERTVEVTRADRPLSIGSTYEERNVVLGSITGQSRWTVVEYEPPRRTTHRGQGLPLARSLDFFLELREVAQATEVTAGLRYRPGLGPLGRLIDRLHARRALQASMERSVRNIAALAERELSRSAAHSAG